MMARQLGCGQVPPRLFLHDFLKPREDIKESIQAKRVFEYKCSTIVYANRPFVPITVTHPSFTSWRKELHDHIFNVPVHPLCLELMLDFHPTSEVIYLFPFFSIMSLFTDQDSFFFLQDIAPAPLARTISYNIEGPISALEYQSPTLAQLMSRYATLDPIFTSSASDKRKAPSLVAPSAAKKRRTTKKLLIQVRILSFLNIKPFFILIIFILCDFRLELSNHWSSQNLPMLHLLEKFSPSYFFNHFLFIGIYPLLISCRGNLGEPNYG
jgi:hypothetical protein